MEPLAEAEIGPSRGATTARQSSPPDPGETVDSNAIVVPLVTDNGCIEKGHEGPSEESEECLNALFITDPEDDMETIEHSNGKLLEGSGTWLQEDSNFAEWLRCPRCRVLLISGDPGKGKTMLAISAVKALSERSKLGCRPSSTVVAYFFCDSKDNRRGSLIALLRSILYQVIQQRPDLSSHFRTVWNKLKDHIFTSSSSLQSLWRILKSMFASSRLHDVYIVVDALDELDEESAQDILKLLSPVIQAKSDGCSGELQQQQSCRVKWLLTCRNIPSLTSPLRQALHVSLEGNSGHVEEVVRKFIDVRVNELQELKGYGDTLAGKIRDTLREKAEGTFLYVSMASRALSRPTINRINTQAVLKKLPRGLSPLYEKIMDRINAIEGEDEAIAEYAKAILRSMVLCLRPLSLQEIAVAANLPEEHRDDPEMLHEYIAQCGPFIARRQVTIHFVHETVRTYLRDTQSLFSLPISDYHAQLTNSFLKAMDERHESSSTLGYPGSLWMHHARQSGSSIQWKLHMDSEFFAPTSHSRQKWLCSFWDKNHAGWDKRPATLTALQLAAYGGIQGLALALLDRGDAVDEPDSNGYTPLIWAAKNGHADMVKILVGNSANCEAETHDHATALAWASINGHYEVVQQLIRAHASVRVADDLGWSPLHHAAANSHDKVVSSLLDAGANIDARDTSQQTALQRAAFCANLPIAKCLVAAGADTTVQDKDGLSLLHLASRDGHQSLVEFWLSHDKDIEAVDDQEWTPLMHAAWFGHESITARLVRKGANVESRALDGNTPLHLATWNGHVEVVKILLEGKASPDSACNRSETPLHQAAWRGHATICQLLLESGVDANAQTGGGITPLHQAAANGYEDIINLLLEYSGDPNIVDGFDQTPAARAQENNHHSLARLLKSLEIDGAQDKSDAIQDIESSESQMLDPAVSELLGIPPESGYTRPHGKEGFSRPAQVLAMVNGKTVRYFMKSGPSEEMFRGEHEALRALHSVVPSICPYSLGHGRFSNSSDHFLLMEYVDASNRKGNRTTSSGRLSLAQKLAKLHGTPAPTPQGHSQPMFGWPLDTFCGSIKQTNSFHASWAKFYGENRLMAVLNLIDEHHGTDPKLRAGVETIVNEVVPRLLRCGHLGGRRGIVPVLVHGDLWIGNQVFGEIDGRNGPEDVVFDPSVCWAHSEYELGIMRMFGGFSAGFFHEYHRLIPKTEPKEEYEDRITLYQLYQYLNHYLIFRGGYKDQAFEVIKTLASKYSKQYEPHLDG